MSTFTGLGSGPGGEPAEEWTSVIPMLNSHDAFFDHDVLVRPRHTS